MSASLDPSKATEARKELAAGEAAMKTTLLRWKPDYIEAQPHFAKAGKLFKSAGLLDSAIDAWKAAATASLKMGNLKQAALTYEEAARDVALGGGAYKDAAVELLMSAASVQLEAGDPVRSVDLRMRAGKLLEGFNMEKAAKIYDDAAAVFEGDDDKDVYAADALKKILTHQLTAKHNASAVRTMDRLTKIFGRLNQPHNIFKLILSRVILLLADGDPVTAMNEYTRHLDQPGFPESKEAAAAEDLIQAYNDSNPDAVKKVAELNVFTYLETPVVRLARQLHNHVGMSTTTFGSAHDGERATKAVTAAPVEVGGFRVIGGSVEPPRASAAAASKSDAPSAGARKAADAEAAARAALFGGGPPAAAAASGSSSRAAAEVVTTRGAAPDPADTEEEDYDYAAAFAALGADDAPSGAGGADAAFAAAPGDEDDAYAAAAAAAPAVAPHVAPAMIAPDEDEGML